MAEQGGRKEGLNREKRGITIINMRKCWNFHHPAQTYPLALLLACRHTNDAGNAQQANRIELNDETFQRPVYLLIKNMNHKTVASCNCFVVSLRRNML